MEPHEYRFTAKERIEKGWSCDTKYAVTDENGQKYLLRVTPKEKSGSRRAMFDMQKRVDALGVPMCSPIDFWENEEGAHMLQRFIDGVDAEDALTANLGGAATHKRCDGAYEDTHRYHDDKHDTHYPSE